MSIISAILSIFDWAKDKLPISNRLERIKNQIYKLEQEKKELLNGSPTAQKANRVRDIDDTLRELRIRLQNACPDK